MEFYNLMWTVLKELLKSREQDEEGKWNHKNGFVKEKNLNTDNMIFLSKTYDCTRVAQVRNSVDLSALRGWIEVYSTIETFLFWFEN